MVSLYDFYHHDAVEDALRPPACDNCESAGYSEGICPQCLANKAYNLDYLETHLFDYDTDTAGYHDGSHDEFKCLHYRLPDEHPRLYYGIEWEIGFDDESDLSPREVLQNILVALGGLAVCEEDSTVENGAELIFRPISYRALTHPDTIARLETAQQIIDDYAYSDQPTCNGLHIHISKNFFKTPDATSDVVDKRKRDFDWLFQIYQPELEKIGGRKYTSYCASRSDSVKKSMRDMMRGSDSVKKVTVEMEKDVESSLPFDNHHVAVNERSHTIEARIFKSPSDFRTVLAYVELIRNFAHAVRNGVADKQTLDAILHTKDNQYLDDYLRNLNKREWHIRHEKLALDKENTDSLIIESERS